MRSASVQMIRGLTFRSIASLSASALAAIASIHPAFAASHEQIVARCMEAARPAVRECMMARGRGSLEPCRMTVGRAYVYACVLHAEQKQAIGAPAPAAPKDETAPATKDANKAPASFVAPPRNIADITAILDQEMPDEVKIAARKAAADAAPPANASPAKLAQFYYDRANARALLGRSKDAIADCEKAFAVGKSGVDFVPASRIEQRLALEYMGLGDPKKAIDALEVTVRASKESGHTGPLIHAWDLIAVVLVGMGDVTQASAYAGKVKTLVEEARGSVHPRWRMSYPIYKNVWEADADSVRAVIFEARGQYADAEAAYRRATAFTRAAVKDMPKWDHPTALEEVLVTASFNQLAVARNEAKQGKLSEAETDARRALLDVLQHLGKYNPATPHYIVGLAGMLVEQGRYQEAEKLARTALDIERTLGIGDDSAESAAILSQLGNILVLQRKTKWTEESFALRSGLDQ
jgi:tetratricopeptide (TPR) repeat protein